MMSPGCGRLPSTRTEGISNRLQPQCASRYTVKVRCKGSVSLRIDRLMKAQARGMISLFVYGTTASLCCYSLIPSSSRRFERLTAALFHAKAFIFCLGPGSAAKGEQRLDQPAIGSTDM